MVVTIKAVIASFGGKLLKLSHMATSTRCEMAFNLYLPPQAFEEPQKKIPVLIYLSGLTCTADNCSEKGFFQHGASKNGIAVLYPDTSPSTIILFLTGYFFSAHCTMLESLLGIEPQSLPQGYGHEVADTFIGGLNIPGENDSWDFGTGAGFYVDATQQPFNEVYNMYTYVKEELPNVVFQEFPELDPKRVSITGHSMGGHGALMLFLRNPGKYRSVSAFAPICNPINCPWGQKAFSGYLGEKYQDLWRKYDSTELVKGWKGPLNMLIDVGTGDNFYKQGQLLPKNFEQAVTEAGVEGLCMRYQPGYDHSYYTMASFSDDHVAHAARYLL